LYVQQSAFHVPAEDFILSTQNTQGTDAEYIAIPWDKIFPIPPESKIDTRTAAAGFSQATTVLAFMSEAYEVKKGDTILVHTVAGGFGLIAAQYAKYKGATVIGTTSTDAKAELAKRHGADHVILYTKEDTVQRVSEITNGDGVDAVFDGVGKDTHVFFPEVIL
jgi:NADPH:quinone reductase-like Zn-dependent oxidoreductase